MKIERITSTIVDLRLQRAHRLAMTTMAGHTLVIVQIHTDEDVTGCWAGAVLPARACTISTAGSQNRA